MHYEVNEETYSSYADHTGTIYVEGLESGNYEIQLRETEQFVFMPMEIPVPMWDETKQKMSYDITVIPKYSKTEKAPGTGDMANPMLFALMGVSMLGVAVVLQIYKKKQ